MPNPAEGVPLPSMADLKKLPSEALIEQIRQANQALQQEKQASFRKDREWEARLKLECDRLRTATAQHNRELEEQNSTLLKSLTRLQGDLDKAKQEITTLQVRIEIFQSQNGREEHTPAARALAHAPEPQHLGTTQLAPSSAPALMGAELPPKPPNPNPPAPLPAQAQALPQS